MQLKISCRRFALALALLPLISISVDAQQNTKNGIDDQRVLPLDPAIRTGKLSNGFTYYIRKNTVQKGRAVLYLVNKVGSILETDEQQGLAHFMEHMNFNGTTHFPGNKLVDYLEKAGVRFGADLNAYTSYDETVYQLPIPFDQPEFVNNGLQVMRDWAQEALLDPKEIDKERGVILEEKRLSEGVQKRMQNQIMPLLVNGSRYAVRSPIGIESVLVNFKPETLRSFYKDWYRPDLQSLIVVGDVDVDAIEAKVKSMFSSLKKPVNEKTRTKYSIGLEGKNHFIALWDKENQGTNVEVIIKHPARKNSTSLEYRDGIVESLFNQLVGERFATLSQNSDPGYINAGAGVNHFMANLDAFNASVAVRPGELERGFKALWSVISTIKQQGFTGTELERAKTALQSGMQAALREGDKIPSAQYAKEYVRYILDGEASPGIKREAELVGQYLPGIGIADLNDLIQKYIVDKNRDIVITGTEKDKEALPSEETVNTWIASFENNKQASYKEDINNSPLLKDLPAPGKIVSEKKNDKLKITELKLSNGVRVILKPTSFKNDEILISSFSPGGTSLYSDKDFQSATNAASIIAANGIGDFSPVQLKNKITGKEVNVNPYINERYVGISGGSSGKDMETELQLIYLYYTHPRKDTSIFNGNISRTKFALASRANSPESAFSDTVNAMLGNHNIRRTGPSLTKLRQVDLDQALAIYKERFADAAGFTFVLSGSFDVQKIKPLLEQYLGALPATNKGETAKDLGIEIPKGIIEKNVYKGHENKATVKLVISGDFNYNPENNLELKALKDILEFRLLDRLRESEGGVYSPGTNLSISKSPRSRYALTINFGCSPANVEKLIASTWDEISKLKKEGPPKDDIIKFKAEEKLSFKGALETNNFWENYLMQQYQTEESPENVLDYERILNGITEQKIKTAAGIYLDGENYIRIVLLPEKVSE